MLFILDNSILTDV